MNNTPTIMKYLLKYCSVEPVMFLFSLGFGLTIIISPILYFEKTCAVSVTNSFIYIDLINYYFVKNFR